MDDSQKLATRLFLCDIILRIAIADRYILHNSIFLDRGLRNYFLVCKQWRDLTYNDEIFWRKIYKLLFGDLNNLTRYDLFDIRMEIAMRGKQFSSILASTPMSTMTIRYSVKHRMQRAKDMATEINWKRGYGRSPAKTSVDLLYFLMKRYPNVRTALVTPRGAPDYLREHLQTIGELAERQLFEWVFQIDYSTEIDWGTIYFGIAVFEKKIIGLYNNNEYREQLVTFSLESLDQWNEQADTVLKHFEIVSQEKEGCYIQHRLNTQWVSLAESYIQYEVDHRDDHVQTLVQSVEIAANKCLKALKYPPQGRNPSLLKLLDNLLCDDDNNNDNSEKPKSDRSKTNVVSFLKAIRRCINWLLMPDILAFRSFHKSMYQQEMVESPLFPQRFHHVIRRTVNYSIKHQVELVLQRKQSNNNKPPTVRSATPKEWPLFLLYEANQLAIPVARLLLYYVKTTLVEKSRTDNFHTIVDKLTTDIEVHLSNTSTLKPLIQKMFS